MRYWAIACGILGVWLLGVGSGLILYFDGGLAVGPLTFRVEYIPGSWFPGRNY